MVRFDSRTARLRQLQSLVIWNGISGSDQHGSILSAESRLQSDYVALQLYPCCEEVYLRSVDYGTNRSMNGFLPQNTILVIGNQ